MDGQPATATQWTTGEGLTGTGLGLRSAHITRVLSQQPLVPWFEILADNHTASGGLIPRQLAAVRADYPITLHCVGMSLGGTDPLDYDYLRTIKRLMQTYEPVLVSDHLCFSSHASHQYHDLLPLPYTEEALRHVTERVRRVQDFLGIRLLVENVSSYLTYRHSTLSEPEFLAALAGEADCDLLFDVNNDYVNAVNHGDPAGDFISQLPQERIREIHLAGYEDKGDYLIDAHNNRVADPVWALFSEVIRQLPDIPVLIEWDNDIPALDILLDEAAQAERIREACSTEVTCRSR
ncbi:MAG TPA: hypothetical protein DCO71_04810 [Gammaproteobacteria bacterium]|nr:hypothetical protein [Gammaproteobacteria bacterium]